MKQNDTNRSTIRIDVAPRTIGVLLVTIAGIWLAHELWAIAVLLIVALIFAGTINPVAEWLEERGVGRMGALALIAVGVGLLVALLVFLTIPPLIEQTEELLRSAPELLTKIITALDERNFTSPLARVIERAGPDGLVAELQAFVVGNSADAMKGLGYFATSVMLAFYLLADGKRTQGIVFALVPRNFHMRLARILHNLERIVGGYMRGQLLTSGLIGAFTFVLLVACGVPNALSLALLAAVADVIPFVGGFLAAGPAVISAMPSGIPVAVGVALAMAAYMEFESRVLIPKIYGQVLRLAPLTVVVALLVGGTLLGVMGALLALPIAAGLQMMLEELRVELPGDDSDDRSERARNAKTEATYERMSAGASAPEAGKIARDLAEDMRVSDELRGITPAIIVEKAPEAAAAVAPTQPPKAG